MFCLTFNQNMFFLLFTYFLFCLKIPFYKINKSDIFSLAEQILLDLETFLYIQDKIYWSSIYHFIPGLWVLPSVPPKSKTVNSNHFASKQCWKTHQLNFFVGTDLDLYYLFTLPDEADSCFKKNYDVFSRFWPILNLDLWNLLAVKEINQ